jgi:flavin-dependent dehydrogenase
MKCAGIVSGKILNLLPIPARLVLDHVGTAIIRGPDGETIPITTRDQPVVLDRIGLDKYLYARAAGLGATFHLGERATGFERAWDGIVITTSKHVFRTKIVVGCDGAHSAVAKWNGVTNRFITGKQIIVDVAATPEIARLPPRACELCFHPAWKDLFAWIIPAGKTVYRIGMARADNVSAAFSRFLSWRFGVRAEGFLNETEHHVLARTGGTIPIGLMKPCAFDRAILVGDAACQVKATTGGGIVMALSAANIAANAIVKCVATGDFSKNNLRRWYQRSCSGLARTLKVHYIVHEALGRFSREDFSKLFSIASNPSVRAELLRSADMDFPLRFLLRLMANRHFLSWLLSFASKNVPFLVLATRAFLGNKENV